MVNNLIEWTALQEEIRSKCRYCVLYQQRGFAYIVFEENNNHIKGIVLQSYHTELPNWGSYFEMEKDLFHESLMAGLLDLTKDFDQALAFVSEFGQGSEKIEQGFQEV